LFGHLITRAPAGEQKKCGLGETAALSEHREERLTVHPFLTRALGVQASCLYI